jgi:H+-transporting ATPase
MSATASFEGLSRDEAVDRLGVNPARGLSQHQVEARLEQHGPNEIPEKEEPFTRRLLRRFWGPIPWAISTSASRSLLTISSAV